MKIGPTVSDLFSTCCATISTSSNSVKMIIKAKHKNYSAYLIFHSLLSAAFGRFKSQWKWIRTDYIVVSDWAYVITPKVNVICIHLDFYKQTMLYLGEGEFSRFLILCLYTVQKQRKLASSSWDWEFFGSSGAQLSWELMTSETEAVPWGSDLGLLGLTSVGTAASMGAGWGS